MANTYSFVNIDNRKAGKWIQNKSIISSNECKLLEVKNSYPFVRMAVNDLNNNIIVGDKFGSIYLIDISSQSFHLLLKLDSCLTCIAFVYDLEEINLIVTTVDKNTINCLNYCTQSYLTEMIANMSSVHKTCIDFISILGQRMITSSRYDRSCIWDLNTFQLLKQLSDQRLCQSVFLSIDRIIVSYRNPDVIYVFDCDTLQVSQTLKQRQLLSAQKNSFIARNLTNDCDLEINTINDSNELSTKTVKPINGLKSMSVRHVFICENNRSLIYFTTDGLLMCDKYQDFDKTARFTTISINKELMTGISTKGDLHVFDLKVFNHFILRRKAVKRPQEVIEDNEEEVTKLSLTLLRKYQKFPQKYRYFIWSKLLSIPLNKESFKRIQSQSNFYNKELDKALTQLQTRHKVIDDSLRLALKRTIAQLIYLKPKLLIHIEDLALFSFPFIKLFLRNELILFETLATLLLNKYFISNSSPEEQSQMFELISTLLKRVSLKLSSHFIALKVNSSHYSLPLIKSLFSEVFLRNDWLILCDNLLIYGPKMFIYLVVSYCHLSKDCLLKLRTIDEIYNYFRSQNSMPVKKVIQMSHSLSEKYVSLMPFAINSLPKNVYN